MRRFAFFLAVFLGLLSSASASSTNGGWLGAEVSALTPDAVAKLHGAVTSGAMIVRVVRDSPAATAGLKTGEVVTRADGQTVFGPNDLVRIVGKHSAGDSLLLMVIDASNGFNSRFVTVGLSALPQKFARSTRSKDDDIYTGFDDFKAPPEGNRVLKDPNWQSDLEKGGFDAGPANSKNVQASGKGPRSTVHGALSRGYSQLISVGLLRGQYCHALAPAGWAIAEEVSYGRGMSLISADGRMKASYAIVGINSGAALIYVRPQGGDPVTQALTLASLVAGQRIQGVFRRNFLGASLIDFRGTSEQGYVLFRTYPVPGQPYSYVLSTHIAVGPTQREEAIAGAVAATINCVAQFHPPEGGYAQVQPRSQSQATGTSSRCRSGNCDDGDLAGTYNVQLGTGYVHSETTGQNYLVDPSTDYHETGPDGPGYYRQAGNSYEKLTPGWQ